MNTDCANTGYAYNAANRLVSAISGMQSSSYTYDGTGRITSQTVNGEPRTMNYSFRSQMTSLTDTNSGASAYDFDADGNRTKQTQAGCLASRYVYDGPNVVLELNASNQVTRAYVNGRDIDQPIERIDFINSEARTRLVYHTDGLGSVVALTDSGQQTAKSYTYEAFGKIRSESGNALVLNRYTYTAREALGDSLGLYYYRWRVMDPNVGRFTSEDPLGFEDSGGLYVYVNGNPVIRIDPLGLWYIDVNVNLGVGIGITFGFQVGSKGFHPYAGGGLMTPGVGGSITWSPQDPCPKQWSGQVQGAFGLAGAQGADLKSITKDFNYWEVGAGTPGISGTVYYTW